MNNENDGKLGATECGETEWKKRYFCCEKPMAPPPHILLAGSKIRSVFGELTCCCGQWGVGGWVY